ncbi:MAG TPA: PorV/PorQ family protein [Candidatus Eisenbacteria bacterium]|nr:PorV/PorQ family protein [Candidatus Eisenbacteria bacterium]
MSRILSAILGLLLIAGLAGSARAQSEAGAQSLLIAPGARSDGMGRAFAAIANDANAVWWNPGGMAFARGHDASFMYTQLVPDLADDVNYSYLAYVQHVEGWGGIGGSVGYLSYGKSLATDEFGNDIGEFTSYEIAPTIAYGTEIVSNFGVGVALKLVRVDLAPAFVSLDGRAGRGTTFAADIGGLVKAPGLKSSFGAVIQNLGPNIAYIDEDQSDPLGRNLKVGVGYSPIENEVHRVLVAADANRFLLPGRTLAVDVWSVGAEYEFNRLLALRVGYISDPRGTIEDMTFGLGLGYRGFRFDYASVPQSEFLERVNRFSASYHF